MLIFDFLAAPQSSILEADMGLIMFLFSIGLLKVLSASLVVSIKVHTFCMDLSKYTLVPYLSSFVLLHYSMLTVCQCKS